MRLGCPSPIDHDQTVRRRRKGGNKLPVGTRMHPMKRTPRCERPDAPSTIDAHQFRVDRDDELEGAAPVCRRNDRKAVD